MTWGIYKLFYNYKKTFKMKECSRDIHKMKKMNYGSDTNIIY